MFNLSKIDHIRIAVKDIEQAKKFYTEILGLKVVGEEVVEQQNVKVCFIPCGNSEIELLESNVPDGPVAKFIENKGEGLQHIAPRVDNIVEALAVLKEKGIRFIDEQPRYGAGGARIAFVHPKSTGGVLLELAESKD